MRQLIRPNRQSVILWYVRIVLVGMVLSASDVSTFIVDAADIDNGTVEWLIRIAVIGIALFMFLNVRGPSFATSWIADEGS